MNFSRAITIGLFLALSYSLYTVLILDVFVRKMEWATETLSLNNKAHREMYLACRDFGWRGDNLPKEAHTDKKYK